MPSIEIRGRRILLADDDEQVQDLVHFTAERCGHELVSVTSAHEVLRATTANQPDIVVLDLGFPDADGRDLLQQLKSNPKTARIPVIVWSGRAGHATDRRVSLDLGAEDYLEKNDPLLLLRKVERVLLRLDEGQAESAVRQRVC